MTGCWKFCGILKGKGTVLNQKYHSFLFSVCWFEASSFRSAARLDPAGGLKQTCQRAPSEQSGQPLLAFRRQPGASAVLFWLLLAHGSGLPVPGSNKFTIYLSYCYTDNPLSGHTALLVTKRGSTRSPSW